MPSPPRNDRPTSPIGDSRRNFFKGSGLLLAGGALVGGQIPLARAAHAYGSDSIRIGLVGCGGRGTGAALQAMNTIGGGVRLTAMADVFENNLQTAYRSIKGKNPGSFAVTSETRFVGLDAYQRLLETDIDLVILATPPGFRPLHFEQAVRAGKHVFMEKPVAVDAPGVRRVLAAGKMAEQMGLAVQVGFQRRHETRYQECIARLHDGAIGEPIFARAYWNSSGVWTRPRRPQQTELEYQINNWYYFNWLSGDHITEQHVHNLDIINWALQSVPSQAQGQGGRQVRQGESAGQIFDHHMVEFTYPGGTRLLSQCRHMAGCWMHVGEHLHGTLGYCDISTPRIFDLHSNLVWESKTDGAETGGGENRGPESRGRGWQKEQDDLFAALRRGERPNETQQAAHSTLTAIMGRIATYGGKSVTWDQVMASDVSLADVDTLHSLDSPAPVLPDRLGQYQIAVPGKTPVV